MTWKACASLAGLVAVGLASVGHFADDLVYYGSHPLLAWLVALGVEASLAATVWAIVEREGMAKTWAGGTLLLLTGLSMLANGHHAQVEARAARPDLSAAELRHATLLWVALPLLNIALAGIFDGEVRQQAERERAQHEQAARLAERRTSADARRLSTEHEQRVATMQAEHEQAMAAQRAEHEQRLAMLASSPPSTTNGRPGSPPRQPVSTDDLLADITAHPASSDGERSDRLGCSRSSVQRRRAALVGDGRIRQDDSGAWRVAEEALDA